MRWKEENKKGCDRLQVGQTRLRRCESISFLEREGVGGWEKVSLRGCLCLCLLVVAMALVRLSALSPASLVVVVESEWLREERNRLIGVNALCDLVLEHEECQQLFELGRRHHGKMTLQRRHGHARVAQQKGKDNLLERLEQRLVDAAVQ